eukprot:10356092-Alexandrium_andersonii.AAC.1
MVSKWPRLSSDPMAEMKGMRTFAIPGRSTVPQSQSHSSERQLDSLEQGIAGRRRTQAGII